MVIYIHTSPPLWLLLPPHSHPASLCHHRALSWVLLYSRLPFTICFTHGSVFVNPNLPIDPILPSPSPPGVHMSTLYACVYIPGLQRGSSVPNVISIFFFNAMWRDFDSSSKGLTTKSQCPGSLHWGQVVLFLGKGTALVWSCLWRTQVLPGLSRCYLPHWFSLSKWSGILRITSSVF